MLIVFINILWSIHVGLKPGTEYIIKIVALNNAQRSVPLIGKAETRKYTFVKLSLTIQFKSLGPVSVYFSSISLILTNAAFI